MTVPAGESEQLDDLAVAHCLADASDVLTLARFRSLDLHVEAKADRTPVSDADRAVELAAREVIGRHRPRDAIIGEEFGASGDATRRWVIDPIDGTKCFVRGLPVWATLIALLVDDEAVIGVVSAPALGRRWWGQRGGGAWLSEFGEAPRRLTVSSVSEVADATLSYSTLDNWGERRGALLRLCDAVALTRAYGDFWSYMLVAEGSVDIALEPVMALWDTAALAPIIVEAGGRLTDLDGREGIDNGSALATNGYLQHQTLTVFKDY